MSKVDIDKLSEYADTLSKGYVDLIGVMNDISASIDNVSNLSNWDSPAGDEFKNNANVIKDNFDICSNKQKDVNAYLEKVIGNYRTANSILLKVFDYFKRGE